MGKFIIPDFLQKENYEEVLARMLQELPDTIGKEENGWVCDLFSPVALEHARAIQFVLLEAIKNILPQYAYGDILLGHAENRGIFQKQATYAKAILQVTGNPGTSIPAGFQFSTTASLTETSIIFRTVQETVIPESGIATVEAQCQIAGKKGNVAAETIILLVKPQKGINSVTNMLPAYGGFEAETEESVRQRIMDYDFSQGNSFVGSPADYRRWALAVEGVGSAQVIPSEDNKGTVTIVVTDLNGMPADETLCKAVENYIMRPDSIYERLAPINALLHVIPASTVEIAVSATVLLKKEYTIEEITTVFITKLNEYFQNEKRQIIKYTELGALLINIDGVFDYENLLLNGADNNIIIHKGEIAVLKENGVSLTV